MRERVVHQVCKRVIEPIFAAHFQHTSDGFRPKRRAHQAVNAVKQARIRGWWVVEATLHHDCDPSVHPLRLSLVARRISDGGG